MPEDKQGWMYESLPLSQKVTGSLVCVARVRCLFSVVVCSCLTIVLFYRLLHLHECLPLFVLHITCL